MKFYDTKIKLDHIDGLDTLNLNFIFNLRKMIVL